MSARKNARMSARMSGRQLDPGPDTSRHSVSDELQVRGGTQSVTLPSAENRRSSGEESNQ